MGRFNFGSLEAEPSSMKTYYDLMVDATGRDNLVTYAVPADLQTPRYANSVLGRYNGPELAAARADVRIRREGLFREAGVHNRTLMSAWALTNLHIVGRDVLLEQLDAVQAAVAADVAAGERRVGIIPAQFVRPLPAEVPPGMAFNCADDISTVTTLDGFFVAGPDGFEIDRYGSAGLRGREAARRLDTLEQWAGLAVTGAAALDLIDESRAVVRAA